MASGFTVKGDREIIKRLKGADKIFLQTMNDWRDYVIDKSQEYVPKDTGHLMRSMDVEVDEPDRKRIAYGAEYAVYVELGTATMEEAHGVHDPEAPVKMWAAKAERMARDNQIMPYLRPAFYEANRRLQEWARKNVKNLKP